MSGQKHSHLVYVLGIPVTHANKPKRGDFFPAISAQAKTAGNS